MIHPPPQRGSRPFDLTDRVAVITGGAGMLGQMHAEAIAEAGGIPILADTRGEAAEASARAVRRKYGRAAMGVRTDVTRKDDVEHLREVAVESFDRIDILINNAANDPKVDGDGASLARARFETFPLQAWVEDLDVGLTGAFLCAQVLGSEMARRGTGAIINISSDLGLVAPDFRIYRRDDRPDDEQPVKPVSYSVVKTALLGLTRYLAVYWATRGVRVNALCPGGVEAGQPQDFKDRLERRIPMGRMACRDEYKGAIVFLASDASSYMTGAILSVDGGRTAW